MKKSLFILSIAAVALASCSSDETITREQKNALVNADQLQIAPIVSGATRATSTTTATLSEFDVYIEGKFQKGEENTETWTNQVQKMTKDGSTWKFPGNAEYWWADKTTTAEFLAVAPTGKISGTTKPTTTSVTVKDTIAKQEDWLVAYNSGVREDFDAGVPINFQHVLSQVIFKANNKSTDDIKVEVAGVKLVNVKNQNTLTFPTTSTAKGDFSWDDYTPWTGTAAGKAIYENWLTAAGETAKIQKDAATVLTATATNLADPMLLMPQQLAPQDLTATSKSSMTNNYLAILVKVSGGTVGKRDKDGKYYGKKEGDTSFSAIDFTTKRNDSDDDNNSYTADELKALEKGEVPTGTGWSAYKEIEKETEVIYPRVGYATSTDQFAFVGVALDQEWKPGYRYTYTLSFSKDGIGKSIADQPADADGTEDNYPRGKDMESGQDVQPGEDIIDNPTQLLFSVTVDEWIDADPINQDL